MYPIEYIRYEEVMLKFVYFGVSENKINVRRSEKFFDKIHNIYIQHIFGRDKLFKNPRKMIPHKSKSHVWGGGNY